jgi:hypothetical protein
VPRTSPSEIARRRVSVEHEAGAPARPGGDQLAHLVDRPEVELADRGDDVRPVDPFGVGGELGGHLRVHRPTLPAPVGGGASPAPPPAPAPHPAPSVCAGWNGSGPANVTVPLHGSTAA